AQGGEPKDLPRVAKTSAKKQARDVYLYFIRSQDPRPGRGHGADRKSEMKARPKAKIRPKARAKVKPAKTRPLFTIGYEQAKPAAVFGELERAKIELLVDTRAVAASRRPGFSKRQLAGSLDEAGIGYIHLQKLGTPAEGRAAARSGNTDALWRIYDNHIKTREAQADLHELITLIRSGKRVALLCYCRDAKTCHRSRIVANVRKRTQIKVDDLI